MPPELSHEHVVHGYESDARMGLKLKESATHTHTTGHKLPHRHVDPLPDRPWWSWPRLTALCQFYFLENSHGVDWCVASLSWDGIFSPGFMDPILGLFLLAPFSAGLASRLRVCLKIILLLFKKQQHYNTSGSKAAILGYIGHCSKAMFVIPSCHTSVDISWHQSRIWDSQPPHSWGLSAWHGPTANRSAPDPKAAHHGRC